MNGEKLLSLLLAAVLLLSLCACSGNTDETGNEEILQARRQVVLDEMRHLVSFLWSPVEDITYSKQSNSKGIENDDPENVTVLRADRIYSGLPYTHGCGSAYDFQAFATGKDENGVYEISGMTSEALTGVDTFEENRRSRVGCDCSEGVYWAWSRISPSVDFKATYEMTEEHGCIRVGSYSYTPEQAKKTKEVTQQNGAATMFESYAQLQPGDAVVHSNLPDDGSHAMMVTSVVVEKNKDGTPNYMNSYVTTDHQTPSNLFNQKSYYDDKLNQNIYLCGKQDEKFLFIDLFNMGYLPVTCKELIDASPIEPATVTDTVATPGADNITEGVFSSRYAVSNVTVTISDENGTVVQKVTGFATETELKAFDLSHLADPEEVKVGSLDVAALPAGNYHCTHTCMLSTAETITVRDFDFVIE